MFSLRSFVGARVSVLVSVCVSGLTIQHPLSYSESACQICELPNSFSCSYLFLSHIHLIIHLISTLRMRKRGENPQSSDSCVSFSDDCLSKNRVLEWHSASHPLPGGWACADRMEQKTSRILSYLCYPWLVATRLLQVGFGIFLDVIWISLVTLRLLVGLKILRPYLTNDQKSGISVVTSNLRISITYHSKHSFLTHRATSHWPLCWFDWAQLNCFQAIGWVHICSIDLLILWSRPKVQPLSAVHCAYWGQTARRNVKNTVPWSLCSELAHCPFTVHWSEQLIHKAKAKVSGVEIYAVPTRKHGQVTWKWVLSSYRERTVSYKQ